MEELAASITAHGVLQPVLFRADFQTESLCIVAGERRCAAAQLAGLTTIPAIFVDGNTAEIALVENLLRQDLTAVEEAEALLPNAIWFAISWKILGKFGGQYT